MFNPKVGKTTEMLQSQQYCKSCKSPPCMFFYEINIQVGKYDTEHNIFNS